VGDEDRWQKLEQILKRVVDDALDSRGLRAKTKLGFVNGRWTGVTDEQLEAWKAAYGAVDIEAELKRAAAWIVSNPTMAPKNQHGRFLNTWLSRTQNQSSLRSIPTRSEPQQGPGLKLCAYCERVATAKVSGVSHCSDHGRDAMEGRPVPMFKNAVVAKPVAGS
jgi:hypothetical protein